MSGLPYRTRIRKVGRYWCVTYYWPGSGLRWAEFGTWRKAMDDACAIEEKRRNPWA